MKKASAPDGRRHGSRARRALDGRSLKTVLVALGGAHSYRWTTDRSPSRPVVLRP
ncbi:MAG: hypothetical protein KGM24_06885 [Elusimicrobia bacterium]|nr:hypothetical protein [Elusimicrobiota bacterium]